jgi:predicted ArsR family transcriptional regulator
MKLEAFDQQIENLASSLGDATRRGIYISIRESPEAMTTAEIAELFDIHPNVARHHLHRLVEDGYLSVTERRRSGKQGPGAGRPAKHYAATAKEVQLQFPARRYDLLAELLVRVIQRLAPADASVAALAVGREYGTELAAEIGLPDDAGFETAALAVARAMTGMGFDTEANTDDHLLVTSFCPFGETAVNHPEIVCKLDQGIVTGLMAAANQSPLAIVTPHSTADEDCITDL